MEGYGPQVCDILTATTSQFTPAQESNLKPTNLIDNALGKDLWKCRETTAVYRYLNLRNKLEIFCGSRLGSICPRLSGLTLSKVSRMYEDLAFCRYRVNDMLMKSGDRVASLPSSTSAGHNARASYRIVRKHPVVDHLTTAYAS